MLLKFQAFWEMISCRLANSPLGIFDPEYKGTTIFETAVTIYQETQRYISEDLKLLKLTFIIIHEDKQYNST